MVGLLGCVYGFCLKTKMSSSLKISWVNMLCFVFL